MNDKDLKVTAIANEVYPMLMEMCGNSGIEITDLIRELAAKQQLVDIRRGITVRPVFDHEAGNTGPSEVIDGGRGSKTSG